MTQPDAELIGLCDESAALLGKIRDFRKTIPDDTEREKVTAPLYRQMDQFTDRIWPIAAHTFDGIRAKASHIVLLMPDLLEDPDPGVDNAFFASILRDLLAERRSINVFSDLEQPLIDLKTMAGLLEHLATSDRAATGQELGHISDVLKACHEDISTMWESLGEGLKATREHEAEVAELRVQLAACEASHAPPGSEADAEMARTQWLLLICAARTVIAEAEKAGVAVTHQAGGRA